MTNRPPSRPSLSFPEQIKLALSKAEKSKDIEAIAYYTEIMGNLSIMRACSSFTQYQNSWSYEQWMNKESTKVLIEKIKLRINRFDYLNS